MFDIEKLKKEVSAFPAGVNTEIRFQRNSTKRVGFLDGRLTSNSTASGRGEYTKTALTVLRHAPTRTKTA